ncbi:glycosyltransferase [Flavobacterium sp. ZT3R17]|uniref:glycosyltransferase n=1 Tax=Flavobacterium cryoconiti TaxID=3398736 RepID=UPI003A86329C
MLSILVPIYNYNAFPLVLELHRQCTDCGIDFEILCQDDRSNEFLTKNQNINSLENCKFSSNNSNIGRGKNINLLAKKSSFNWLLILDCDTFPKSKKFIKNYLDIIKNNDSAVVFGGIIYETKKPQKEKLLRWVYGNKREALSVEQRNKKPNSRALTSNLLIKKEIFIQNPFDSAIIKYGYEDLCFLTVLGAKKNKVSHIDNPTFHLNLETSLFFLNKTKIAQENLAFILDSEISPSIESKIISAYKLLKRLRLVKMMAIIFKKSEDKITSNLLSETPSILLFDIYKLGYFCSIKSK